MPIDPEDPFYSWINSVLVEIYNIKLPSLIVKSTSLMIFESSIRNNVIFNLILKYLNKHKHKQKFKIHITNIILVPLQV